MTEPKNTYANPRELLVAFGEEVREHIKWDKAFQAQAREVVEQEADVLRPKRFFLMNLFTVKRGLTAALTAFTALENCNAQHYHHFAFDPETAKSIINALLETKCRIEAIKTPPPFTKARGAPRKIPEYANKYKAELVERFGYTPTQANKKIREAFKKASHYNRPTVTA